MFCTLSKGVDFMRPLISIIMPVYNCEAFMEESIRSILEQTYRNWELIIVNDGSEDKTEEKISGIKDVRIRLVNLKQHKGLTYAFLEGYKLAKGDFVIRHDGDDISAPNRLELQLKYLLENPQDGMVSCLISCFTRDQSLAKDCTFVERIQNHYVTYEDIQKAIIGGFIPILFPTLMIRKELMDKVNFENKTLELDDHVELLLELIKMGKVRKVEAILYSYRRHKDAYHMQNEKEYNKQVSKLLKDPSVKNHLQYNDFYKELKVIENKIQINEKSNIRVLMLIDALNVGGTETHVVNLTRKLIQRGVYVVVGTSGGPTEAILHSYGIKVIKIPMDTDYISNKKKFGMLKLVKNIIDEEKINLVHCHLFASMQLASELYRMYKIPYVVTVHGLFYPNSILYSSCIMASKVIAVSEPVKEMLEAKLEDRIKGKVVVIQNGVSTDMLKDSSRSADIRRELSIPRNAGILCYCSRLDWNKTDAARVFLFSYSQLLGQFHNLHAVIVGDGPGKEGIEKEAQVINEMVNEKVVHVVGAKVDVIPYYKESEIIIGTGRVALEGMLCSKPIIAVGNQGYAGPITERTRDIQWKMYFGDHDALEKPNAARIARDIKHLILNPEARKKIGDWGKSWCERNFNNDELVREIIQIYKNTLSDLR